MVKNADGFHFKIVLLSGDDGVGKQKILEKLRSQGYSKHYIHSYS